MDVINKHFSDVFLALLMLSLITFSMISLIVTTRILERLGVKKLVFSVILLLLVALKARAAFF